MRLRIRRRDLSPILPALLLVAAVYVLRVIMALHPHWPPRGMHPLAAQAMWGLGITANQITQTIGDADNSAGTHLAEGDGVHPYLVDGQPYSAATDLIPPSAFPDDPRNSALLERLGDAGFAAWLRIPGRDGTPATWLPHVHAVYAGVRMKDSLKEQIWDYVHNHNGLARHGPYRLHAFSDQARNTVWRMFLSVPENREWARRMHGGERPDVGV
jgi:hypothetical protein